jgi:hypothetical protein
MSANHARVVQVRNAWCGWWAAEVDFNDLEDIHWFQPHGAPRAIVHAYVQCTKLRGDIPHRCTATSRPHRLLVCVLKRYAAPSVHSELMRRADNRWQPGSAESTERLARASLVTGTQGEAADRRMPWLVFAAVGGLVLAAILAHRRRPQGAAALAGAGRWSRSKRQSDTVAA